jgi:hypothetical protein
MQSYTFPFSSCEKVSDGAIAQPVSTTINVIVCLSLLAILIYKKPSVHSSVLILTLFVFELWHAYSHARHIPGMTHTYIIHGLTYAIAAASAALIYSTHGSVHLQLACVAIVIDVIVGYLNIRKWSVVTGVMVLAAVLVENYRLLPRQTQHMFPVFVLLALSGTLAFLYEAANCSETMANMRLHALVELIVMAFILLYALTMSSR